MNERIRVLIEQASVRGEVYLPGDDGHPSPTFYFDKEKFAELIVRESMAVTKDYTCNQGLDYSAPVALARHFGVGQ